MDTIHNKVNKTECECLIGLEFAQLYNIARRTSIGNLGIKNKISICGSSKSKTYLKISSSIRRAISSR